MPPMEPDEHRTVLDARRGDREAFGRLVDAYQGMVFAVALNVTCDYTESEDVVQEVFLRAWLKLRSLSDPRRFGPWLYTLARNFAIQYLRKKHRLPVAIPDEVLADRVRSDTESPSEAYARKELSSLLWSEVADLPPRSREAILLYYVEEFSVRRAAEFLDISEDAFKARLHFARGKLRDALTEKIEDELRSRKPTRSNREAILAALPAQTLSIAELFKSAITGKSLVPVLALSTLKKGAILVAVLLLALLSFLVIRPGGPAPGPSNPLPVLPPTDEQAALPIDDNKMDSQTTASLADVPRMPTHTLGGSVLSSLGEKPVPAARVVLLQKGEWVRDALTDERGRFGWVDLPNGTYEVHLDASDPAILDRYYVWPGEIVQVLLRDRDVEDLVFFLDPSTSIAGGVVDFENNPLPGATVRLSHFRVPVPGAVQTSGPDGAFRFMGLYPTLAYRLEGDAPGYVKGVVERLDVDASHPLENVIVRLEKGTAGTIKGRVVNQSEQPVPGVLVGAFGTAAGFNADINTDAAGRFTFHNVPTGRVSVRLELYDQQRTVFIEPNQVAEGCDFVIDQEARPGSVSGVIVDGSDQPITQGMVVAVLSDSVKEGTAAMRNGTYNGSLDRSTAAPDSEGRFRLLNLEEGGRIDVYYRGMSGPRQKTSALSIPVSSENVRAVFAPAPDKGFPLSGRVIDGDTREPIPQFTIELLRIGNLLTGYRSASLYHPEGKFEISNVSFRKGRAFVHASAPGYAANLVEAVLDETSQSAFVEIPLGSGAEFSGHIRDSDGQPVVGATVSVFPFRGPLSITDAEGAFRFEHLESSNRYRPCASHPDYAPWYGDALRLEADSSIADFEIVLSRGGEIMGGVLDEAATPVARVAVEIEDDNRDFVVLPVTDTEGMYSHDKIPPGEYRVSVDSLGYEKRDVTVREGETVAVDFGVMGASLSGLVRVNGQPLDNLMVGVTDRPNDPSREGVVAIDKTDLEGAWRLGNVPAGRRFLAVWNRNLLIHAQPIEIQESGSQQVDLNIRTATIRGRVVRDDDRTPLPGRVIVLFHSALTPLGDELLLHLGARAGYTHTDAEGRFTLDLVPDGECLVQVRGPDLGPCQSVKRFAVRNAQPIDDLVLRVSETGTLKVRFVDAESGRPIRCSGNVILRDSAGRSTMLTVRSDSEETVYPGVSADTYAVGAAVNESSGDDLYSPFRGPVVIEAEKETAVTLSVQAGVEVSIDVFDSDGNPINEFQFALTDASGAAAPFSFHWSNSIHTVLPLGAAHLKLIRDGALVYDEDIAVARDPVAPRVEVRVVVESAGLAAQP